MPEIELPTLGILHLVPSVGPASGGLGHVALALAQEQRRLGHKTTIWCFDSPPEAHSVAMMWGPGDLVVANPVFGWRKIGYSPQAERLATSQGRDYCILHQHSIWTANSRVTNCWRTAFGRPTVITPHGALEEYALKRSSWKKRFVALAYETRNMRSASCLHALSESEAVSFRHYGLGNPIAVIPNGVLDSWVGRHGNATRFRDRFQIPPDKRLVLFLSRLHPKKGLPFLIESVCCLYHQLSNWQVVIAGPDEDGHRGQMESLSQKLGTEDLIRFVGPLSGDDKLDAFAASDLFILPTRSEGSPIAILEALGVGLPVITTYGAPWEELKSYQCGWWVEISVEGIQAALLDAIQRPKGELMAMGQRGKALVEQRYTWRIVAARFIELYWWLLGEGERPDFVVTA